MKKIFVLLMAAILFISAIPAFANSKDTPSSWAKSIVQKGIDLGIVPERLQSKYQTPITREEFAELIVNVVFANEKFMAYNGDMFTDHRFTDEQVQSWGSHWWTKEKVFERVTLEVEFEDAQQDHVKLAYILGSINGVSDTKFEPDKLITRQEAAMMLVNTAHIDRGFNYTFKGYSDFDEIADWAKPAVQAAWAIGYMQGVGDKFDYAGYITREQAIAASMRLYGRTTSFTLRGNLHVYPEHHELRFRIGKKYIIADVVDDEEHTALDIAMIRTWNNNPTIKALGLEYKSLVTAVATFGFQSMLRPTSVSKEAVEVTALGKPSKWDFGYMIVSFYDKDGLVRFDYKDIPGYLTQINGYKYGYPFKEVTATRIE